jgi:hypothetical protein
MLQGVAVVDQRTATWWPGIHALRADVCSDYPERHALRGPADRPASTASTPNAESWPCLKIRVSISEVEKRLDWLRQRATPIVSSAGCPMDGTIDIHGVPMPQWGVCHHLRGYHATHRDSSDGARGGQARSSRTGSPAAAAASRMTNAELQAREPPARRGGEQSCARPGVSKSRFMSATSHDLLQPINAARLFRRLHARRVCSADG